MAPIIAEMDGVLSIILADDGVVVAAGEKVAELELMKMFFGIEAPMAGTVRWRVAVGEIIAHGDVIAEIVV